MLGFWCHRNRENGVEDNENGKNFKLYLSLNKKLSEEEEESNDDLERLLSFIGTVIRRDTRRMS